MLLIKPRILLILQFILPLFNFLSLLPHLQQVLERTVLSIGFFIYIAYNIYMIHNICVYIVYIVCSIYYIYITYIYIYIEEIPLKLGSFLYFWISKLVEG